MEFSTLHRFVSQILLIFFFLSFNEIAHSQDEKINENPLSAKAKYLRDTSAPGAQNEIIVDLELAKDHKAYVDMFKLRWSFPENNKTGTIRVDPSFKFEDKFSKQIREGMSGQAQLSAIVEISEDMKPGEYLSVLNLTYQACTETYCHFPKNIRLEIPLRVVPASEYKYQSEVIEGSGSSLTHALTKGTAYAFLFVFLAGILTSLTPCVFPMIPITLAIIGARAAHQRKFRSFSLSLTYVLGIALTYSLLGVFAAKTGALFGSYLGHPIVVSLIATVFIAMGLSMYGLFDLQVPQFITKRLASGKVTAGYLGAFTTGLLAGVIASPCVGPVLVSILTFVAETKNLSFGFALLFVFALGLGQLFLWLGTFSGLLQKMPKSGPWMEFVKFIFGSIMIASALWYLRPIVNERIMYGLIAVALVLIASGFGAFEKTQGSNRLSQLKRGSLLLTLVVGLAYAGKAVWYHETEALKVANKLPWEPYSDLRLSDAAKDGQPVIIDFWAEWCVACKELEMFTLSDERVRTISEQFVLLKIDATTITPEIERLKRIYHVVGLPTMLFVSASGEVQKDLTLTGFENADKFLSRMQRALSAP